MAALRELRSPELVEVRGRGLLVGVQMRQPEVAARVVDTLRGAGILIGRTGPRNDVLKIRPPLVFGEEHVELVAEALAAALADNAA